jgi:hypothetical protein
MDQVARGELASAKMSNQLIMGCAVLYHSPSPIGGAYDLD